MSATQTDMREFIEALAVRMPPDIHPSAQLIIGRYFGEMVANVEDPALVNELMVKVKAKVAQELNWKAHDCATMRKHKDAAEYRKRAKEFAT
jgi:hypothetical protein